MSVGRITGRRDRKALRQNLTAGTPIAALSAPGLSSFLEGHLATKTQRLRLLLLSPLGPASLLSSSNPRDRRR